MKLLLRLFLLFAAASLGACSSKTSERPNVLLVVADTLRADKLGCYGSELGLTPYLDQLAAESVVFERASAHAPWTLPSMASLLTSLQPREHGAGGQLPNITALKPDVETLATRLLAAGYKTGAIVNVAFLDEPFGVTRGFETLDARYFENNREVRSAEATTDAALSWLDERSDEGPFFLLVHYFDAHAIYDPPQPFRRKFAGAADRENEDFVFGTREHLINYRQGRLELKRPLVRRIEKLYDGEVAYMDGQIGRLLDGLAARKLADDTLVTFTSDHGEEFMDHGGFEHGHSLHRELTHVPLILRWPGQLEPRRVRQAVGLIDVAPTLCELVGLTPNPSYSGRSLVPALQGQELGARSILAHGNFWTLPLTSLETDEFKLILDHGQEDGAPRLFATDEDFREEHDLAARQPDVVQRLRQELIRRETALRERQGGAVELTPELQENLGAFGYATGDEEDDGEEPRKRKE